MVLLHGVGTNGRQMSLILGAPLAGRGFESPTLGELADSSYNQPQIQNLINKVDELILALRR